MSRRPVPAGARGTVRVVAAGLAGALLVTSCSQLERLVGEPDAAERTATVAVLVPSEDAADVNSSGVIAAVTAAMGESAVEGWDVSVEVIATTAADADGDEVAATVTESLETLVDGDLVAVVGGLSRAEVRAAQPVLDRRDIVFVSPADVRPEHTRGADPAAPMRPYASYFRTAVTNTDPVVEAMRYAAAVDGVDAVTVLDTDGGDEPERGAEAIEGAGLTVAVPDQGDDDDAPKIPLTGPVANQADLRARVGAAAGTEAAGLYLAADPSRVPGVLDLFAAAGSTATAFGGAAFDGDVPPDGGEFTGTLLRGRPPALPTTMNATPDGLDEVLADAAPGRHGAAAYDAGTIVGSVLSACLPSAASAADARTGCVGEMDELSLVGLTGDITFDAYGDRVGSAVTVETARNGGWEALVTE